MARKLAGTLATLGLFSSPLVLGLGLGNAELQSSLNQPFKARIQLSQTQGISPSDIRVQLADEQAFSRAGLERPYFLQGLNFNVRENARGLYVDLSSSDSIREPFINLLVTVESPQGRLLREYTFLLDPPSYNSAVTQQYAQNVTENSAPRQPAPLAPSLARSSVSESASQPPVALAAPAAGRLVDEGARRVRVGPSGTLWSLARENRPDNSISIKQAMLAIQEANPDAFPTGNINDMESGSSILIPSAEAMTRRSLNEAAVEVERQNKVWVALKAALARQGQQAPAAPAGTEKKTESLSLVSDQKPVPADDQSAERIKELEDKLSLTEENLDKATREKSELSGRLGDLKKQVGTLRKLISLKDEQLTAMEKMLAKQNQLISGRAVESGTDIATTDNKSDEAVVAEEKSVEPAAPVATVGAVAVTGSIAGGAAAGAIGLDLAAEAEKQSQQEASGNGMDEAENKKPIEPFKIDEPQSSEDLEASGFLADTLKNNGLMIGGGLAALIALVAGALLMKRKKAAAGSQKSSGKSSSDDGLSGGDIAAGAAAGAAGVVAADAIADSFDDDLGGDLGDLDDDLSGGLDDDLGGDLGGLDDDLSGGLDDDLGGDLGGLDDDLSGGLGDDLGGDLGGLDDDLSGGLDDDFGGDLGGLGDDLGELGGSTDDADGWGDVAAELDADDLDLGDLDIDDDLDLGDLNEGDNNDPFVQAESAEEIVSGMDTENDELIQDNSDVFELEDELDDLSDWPEDIMSGVAEEGPEEVASDTGTGEASDVPGDEVTESITDIAENQHSELDLIAELDELSEPEPEPEPETDIDTLDVSPNMVDETLVSDPEGAVLDESDAGEGGSDIAAGAVDEGSIFNPDDLVDLAPAAAVASVAAASAIIDDQKNGAESAPLQEAEAFIASGEYAHAAGVLQGALAESPDDNSLRLRFMEVLVELEDGPTFDHEMRQLQGTGDADSLTKALTLQHEMNERLAQASEAANASLSGSAPLADDQEFDPMDLVELGDELKIEEDASDMLQSENDVIDLGKELDALERDFGRLSENVSEDGLSGNQKEDSDPFQSLSEADLVDIPDVSDDMDYQFNDSQEALRSDAEDFLEDLGDLSMSAETVVKNEVADPLEDLMGQDLDIALDSEDELDVSADTDHLQPQPQPSGLSPEQLADLGDLADLTMSEDDLLIDDDKLNIDDIIDEREDPAIKLDLARAYIDMGNSASAQEALREVLQFGNSEQKDDAQQLMEKLQS